MVQCTAIVRVRDREGGRGMQGAETFWSFSHYRIGWDKICPLELIEVKCKMIHSMKLCKEPFTPDSKEGYISLYKM